MREIAPTILVATVVVSFMIAVSLLAWSDADNQRSYSNRVQTWHGTYLVGDYIEYYWNDSDLSSGSSSRIWNLSISNISSMVEVIDLNYDPSLQSSISSVMPANSTFPLNASFAFNIPESHDFFYGPGSFQGNDPISTPWGILVCQHFNESDQSTDWSKDYWIYHGVLVKETNLIAPSLNQTLTLKSTSLLESIASSQ